jgi:hypothetical protein
MNPSVVLDAVVPVVFEELNRTGHAGHCILTARVLDQVLSALAIPSHPMCVDYEFLNAEAVRQVRSGRSLDRLIGDAFTARTGTGASEMYDHHVVTIIPDGKTATLLDPAIVQVTRAIPDASLPPLIVTDLPFPLPLERGFLFEGQNLVYRFRPDILDFMSNEQWADEKGAAVRSSAVLERLRVEHIL